MGDRNNSDWERHVQAVDIASLRLDGGTQSRLRISRALVREYTALMAQGTRFPPVRAWFDGSDYWLVDGFHRLEAAKENGKQFISAYILHGTLADAQWDSYSANSEHGARRTKSDIRALVQSVLRHPRCHQLSNNELANHLGLPEATLRRWRKSRNILVDSAPVCLVTRGRTTYQMKTSLIGSRSRRSLSSRRKSLQELQRELTQMVQIAGNRQRRILNVLAKWVGGALDGRDAAEAIGRVIGESTVRPSPIAKTP